MFVNKISNEEYMERKLSSNKLEIQQLRIDHRINIAIFEAKCECINKEIDSLELQLSK